MKNLTVLVIEDEIVIYMHISKTLKSFGFENIKIAKDGKTALEIAQSSEIDLVFSDIKLAGETDGIEISKILQSLYNLPIIFITAYKDEETLKKASTVDFIGYLLKPYRQDELEALIKIAIVKYNLSKSSKDIITFEDYQFLKDKKELFYKNKKMELTKKETLFISLLFTNINSIVPYKIIDETVWFEHFVSDNTRRTFIYRVKHKIDKLNLKIEKNFGVGLFKM